MKELMYIYFNPLDIACKSVIGAAKEGEQIQFNLFLLNKKTDFYPQNDITQNIGMNKSMLDMCKQPNFNAVLCLNKDGEPCEYLTMVKTDLRASSDTYHSSTTRLYVLVARRDASRPRFRESP